MSKADDTIQIASSTSHCDIHPAVGGSIGSWTLDGQPMLRSSSAEAILAGDLLGMASFPLVPYSNRIGHGRFLWHGKTVQLAPNFPPEPHAIHGVGWTRPWESAQPAADTAILSLSHKGDGGWPWPFAAEQRIRVTEDALVLGLRVRNLAAHAVPAGFGHHPYCDAAGASLTFQAETVWMNGPDNLPRDSQPPRDAHNFSAGGAVEGRAIDHCYGGVSGPARIAWKGRRYALEIMASASLPAAVLYIPRGGAIFCFEPVPHINNALNLPQQAMPVLQPGQTFEAEIRFQAVAA